MASTRPGAGYVGGYGRDHSVGIRGSGGRGAITRRGWINLDLLGSVALIATGGFLLLG